MLSSRSEASAAQMLRCWISRVKRPCAVPREVTNGCRRTCGRWTPIEVVLSLRRVSSLPVPGVQPLLAKRSGSPPSSESAPLNNQRLKTGPALDPARGPVRGGYLAAKAMRGSVKPAGQGGLPKLFPIRGLGRP
jgi:hypothetical protein